MARKIFRDFLKDGRPKCVEDGCYKPGQNLGTKRKDGSIIYRAQCVKHHYLRYGMKDWAYKQHRINYCENIDGRLGFKCTATIIPEHSENMLDTDHINNNHNDNRVINLHTLCSNCHRVKGKIFGHLRSLTYIKKIFRKNKQLLDSK